MRQNDTSNTMPPYFYLQFATGIKDVRKCQTAEEIQNGHQFSITNLALIVCTRCQPSVINTKKYKHYLCCIHKTSHNAVDLVIHGIC